MCWGVVYVQHVIYLYNRALLGPSAEYMQVVKSSSPHLSSTKEEERIYGYSNIILYKHLLQIKFISSEF